MVDYILNKILTGKPHILLAPATLGTVKLIRRKLQSLYCFIVILIQIFLSVCLKK